MYWEETYLKWNSSLFRSEIKYFTCRVCENFPALALQYDDDQEGPFCEYHWILNVQEQFHKLDRKLENECEGDIPACSGSCVCGRDCHKEEQNRQAELDRKFAEYFENEENRKMFDDTIRKGLVNNSLCEGECICGENCHNNVGRYTSIYG